MKLLLRKAKANGRRDQQILLDNLENALIDTNAKGGVTVTENNEIATVSFQTGRMSTLFEKFLEVPLIDGIYNVNIEQECHCIVLWWKIALKCFLFCHC